MQTTAIYIQNLCVPCSCHCRYCLLSWDGHLRGIDYERSATFAKRFRTWLQEHRPDLDFQFYFGYSMEHPQLPEAIDFLQSLDCVVGRFLQFDGMQFRSDQEIHQLLTMLKDHGIQLIDLTFYGTREYHDRFAGRLGDYDFMMRILSIADQIGLPVEVGIPLTHENSGQLDDLLAAVSAYPLQRLFCFIPHAEGRGHALESVRFTSNDYDNLSDHAKSLLNRSKFKPEREWAAQSHFPKPEKRVLALSLTPDNIDRLESMDPAHIIAWLEQLDDDYYRAIPSLETLIRLYGDPHGEAFYSERDLYLKYQRRYIQEHQLELYDINDERQCFSRRF